MRPSVCRCDAPRNRARARQKVDGTSWEEQCCLSGEIEGETDRILPAAIVQELEPIAAIGDPPTGNANRNGRSYGPPEGKDDISQQSQARKRKPEDLALHSSSLTRKNARKPPRLPSGYLSLRRGPVTMSKALPQWPPRFRHQHLCRARRRSETASE